MFLWDVNLIEFLSCTTHQNRSLATCESDQPIAHCFTFPIDVFLDKDTFCEYCRNVWLPHNWSGQSFWYRSSSDWEMLDKVAVLDVRAESFSELKISHPYMYFRFFNVMSSCFQAAPNKFPVIVKIGNASNGAGKVGFIQHKHNNSDKKNNNNNTNNNTVQLSLWLHLSTSNCVSRISNNHAHHLLAYVTLVQITPLNPATANNYSVVFPLFSR